jgi:hypothetical protein
VLQPEEDTDEESDAVGELLAEYEDVAEPLDEREYVPLLDMLVVTLYVPDGEGLADTVPVLQPDADIDEETVVVSEPLTEYEGDEVPLVDLEYVPLLDTLPVTLYEPDGEELVDTETVLQPETDIDEETDVVGELLPENEDEELTVVERE